MTSERERKTDNLVGRTRKEWEMSDFGSKKKGKKEETSSVDLSERRKGRRKPARGLVCKPHGPAQSPEKKNPKKVERKIKTEGGIN